MPRNAGPVPVLDLHRLSLEERRAQPDRCQERWYRWIASRCAGRRVLDAGAGTGYGLPILRRAGATEVEGFDLLPAGDGVRLATIESYPDRSWDIVLAMDVVEHVEADEAFLRHLLRVAREEVFFSTPNWRQWGCANPYHYREYDPAELRALLGATNLPWLAWGINQNVLLDPWATSLPDDDNASVFGVSLAVSSFRHSEQGWLRLARTAAGVGSVEERLERLSVWTAAKLRPGMKHNGERNPARILDRGEGWCDQAALVILWLAREILGLPGRLVSILHSDGVSGHTVAEVQHPDGRWMMASGSEDHDLLFRGEDGTLLSAADVPAEMAEARTEWWRGRDGRGLGGFFSTDSRRRYYGPDGKPLEVSDDSPAASPPSPLPGVSG